MATSIQCSICEKGAGTCLCTGCKDYFCIKHFNDHHAKLLNELDDYIEERNVLQDQINKTDDHDDPRDTILLQIDEWQRVTIKKVIQAADQARQQVNLPSYKRMEITNGFKAFSDKLCHLKETENVLEDDLIRLKEMTQELKQYLKQFSESTSLELYIEQNDQIPWNRLIYMKKRPIDTKTKQDQQQETDHLATDEKCQSCGERAVLRCGKCQTARYCSVECQKQDWDKHKMNCTPIGMINSADHLVTAIRDGLFPENDDALNDFGFSKCRSEVEKTNLFGVYVLLINLLNVESKKLHQWQQANELARYIRKTSEEAGERATNTRYYVWFLKNQHLVDSRTPNWNIYQLLQNYLPSEDKDKDIHTLEPEAKRISIFLYVRLLMDISPSIQEETWLQFGFCTCKDHAMESELVHVYRALIDQCTLEEFYTNYQSESLEDLLRSKKINGVDSLKARGVFFGKPYLTVYALKQYVLTEHINLTRPTSFDYGFDLCENNEQRKKLRKIYKQLFQHVAFDILHLHKACVSGTIYQYASQFVEADANLMRNYYPV